MNSRLIMGVLPLASGGPLDVRSLGGATLRAHPCVWEILKCRPVAITLRVVHVIAQQAAVGQLASQMQTA